MPRLLLVRPHVVDRHCDLQRVRVMRRRGQDGLPGLQRQGVRRLVMVPSNKVLDPYEYISKDIRYARRVQYIDLFEFYFKCRALRRGKASTGDG